MDTTLSNQVLYSTLLGAMLPPLIAVILRCHWTTATKAAVAFAVCVAGAVGTCYYQGALDAADLGRSVMLVLMAAKTSYEAVWRPTGIAPAIEKATTPKETGQ